MRSEVAGRYYCGQTDDLGHRLQQHNDPGHQLTRTTKRFLGPWELIWCKECRSRGEALRLERRIKQRGIGRYLENRV